jgi:dipeptidyl aminopeptidase/acylaminoacyl peptidase
LFEQGESATGFDLWIYRLGEPKPQPLLHSVADERGGDFSPNGQYIAYASNESGRDEVYVQPFPFTGAKWQISTGGGENPRWSRDGRELFYSGDGGALSVPVETAGSFVKGVPRLVFRMDEWLGFCSTATEGTVCTKSEQAIARVDVMLNWLDKLKR